MLKWCHVYLNNKVGKYFGLQYMYLHLSSMTGFCFMGIMKKSLMKLQRLISRSSVYSNTCTSSANL